MLTIKDFKIGDEVYILKRNKGRNTGPSMVAGEVTSVGRIYVMVGTGSWSHKYMNWNSEYLYEKADYGEPTLLFKTKDAAKDYMEKCELALWLGRISVSEAEKYSVGQLRKVKEILNS